MKELARKIWIIIVCRILISAGFSLSFPYFAIYLHGARGIPMGWIGTFYAVSVLASALGSSVGGTLTDLWGRRPVMLGSLIVRALSIAWLALAVRADAGFLALAAVHILGSFIGAFFDPACAAWVTDRFSGYERVQAYSLGRTGGNLGWALGPALGGVWAAGDYAGLFEWTAAVYLVAAVLVWLWVGESRPREHAAGAALFQEVAALYDPKLLRLCLGVLLLGTVMAHLIAPLSLHATSFLRLSDAQVGALFSLNGALVVLLQVAIIHWFRKERLTTMLGGGAALYALGYGAVGWATGFYALAAAMVVITLGENAVSPTMYALAGNLSGPRTRGRYMGALGLARNIGWALGPLAGGWGLQRWGELRPCPYWFLVAALACASGAVFLSLRDLIGAREEGLREETAQAASAVPAA